MIAKELSNTQSVVAAPKYNNRNMQVHNLKQKKIYIYRFGRLIKKLKQLKKKSIW